MTTRVLEKIANDNAQAIHERCLFLPRRTTRKEPRPELLHRGAFRPRRSREGRFGSASKGIRKRMGSLNKPGPLRCFLEGLIKVCLSVMRCAYASAPKRQKTKCRSTDDIGLAPVAHGDVLCHMLPERRANKSEGWGLGSSAAALSIGCRWRVGGELMLPKAEARSVLRRAV